MEYPRIEVAYEIGTLDTYYEEVANVIETLQRVLKDHPRAYLAKEHEPWSDNHYVAIMSYRMETDEEYNKRVSTLLTRKEQQERRDRKEFERLKEKFGG